MNGDNVFTASRRGFLKKGSIITCLGVVGSVATSGIAAAGIGEGRVGHYHLNNIRPDGSVQDASPQNNHGMNHGAEVARGGGQVGNAFKFDGDGDHVAVGDVADADGTATLTLAAWINPSATGQGDFLTKNTSGDLSNSSWVFRYDGEGDQKISAHFNDNSDNWTMIRSDSTVSPGAFTHAAVTIDGSTRRLFIDGTEDASDSFSATLDDESAPVIIGAADKSGGGVTNEFDGLLDEVRIYNRALSAAEVTSLASMGGNSSAGGGNGGNGNSGGGPP